jgi:hypothetical protein
MSLPQADQPHDFLPFNSKKNWLVAQNKSIIAATEKRKTLSLKELPQISISRLVVEALSY